MQLNYVDHMIFQISIVIVICHFLEQYYYLYLLFIVHVEWEISRLMIIKIVKKRGKGKDHETHIRSGAEDHQTRDHKNSQGAGTKIVTQYILFPYDLPYNIFPRIQLITSL